MSHKIGWILCLKQTNTVAYFAKESTKRKSTGHLFPIFMNEASASLILLKNKLESLCILSTEAGVGSGLTHKYWTRMTCVFSFLILWQNKLVCLCVSNIESNHTCNYKSRIAFYYFLILWKNKQERLLILTTEAGVGSGLTHKYWTRMTCVF